MQLNKLSSEHYHWWSISLVILLEILYKKLFGFIIPAAIKWLSQPYHYTAIAWQAYPWRLNTACSRKKLCLWDKYLLSMKFTEPHWLCHWERYLMNGAVYFMELPHLVTHFFTIIELFTSHNSDKRSMASMSNTWLVNSVNKPWKSPLWLVNHSHHWMYK